MRDAEAELLAALDGKFFWEPSSNPDDKDNGNSLAIRKIQQKFAKNARIVNTKRGPDVINTESIKPMKRVLKGEEKVISPIIQAISTAYDISMDDLLGKSTSQKFAKPKMHLYWALFKYIPNLSLAESGRLMNKCHTTVLHGRRMFQKNMDMMKVVEVERLMGVV